jgi:WD40 repeat protein
MTQDKPKPVPAAKPAAPPAPSPYPGFQLSVLKPGVELKHSSPLVACRFDPTGNWLISASQDNGLQRWELSTSKKTDLAGHTSWVRALAFSTDGKTLYSGGYDGQILSWQLTLAQPEPNRQVRAHDGWVRSLGFHGNRLVSGGNDGRISIRDANDLREVLAWQAHDCHVYQVAFSPDGTKILSGDHKGRVKVWEKDGRLIREFVIPGVHKYDTGFRADIGGVRAWSFSPDGAGIACAGITNVSNAFAGVGNPLIVVADWTTGKIRIDLKPKEAFQGTMWGVAWNSAGFIVGAAGGNGGMLWFWKPDQQAELFAHKLPDNVRDMALSADSKRIAVAFQGGAVRVYPISA